MLYRPPCASRRRRGAALVELAFVLPLLSFLTVVGADFGQIFYYDLTVYNCARNGALWACDPVQQANSPYTSVDQAALADASNLNPTPTVAQTTSANGDEVIVTVTYQFSTITGYPGIPRNWNVSHAVSMKIVPRLPSF